MHKTVKTYNMCYYEAESKIYSLYICWSIDVTFTLCQARSHGSIQGQCP